VSPRRSHQPQPRAQAPSRSGQQRSRAVESNRQRRSSDDSSKKRRRPSRPRRN
jgi:hypothetical protein